MDKRAIVSITTLALATALISQQNVPAKKEKQFTDPSRNMVVRHFNGLETNLVDRDTLSFVFDGEPVQLEWKEQRLKVDCQTINGTAARKKAGPMELVEATMKGNVAATMMYPSESKLSDPGVPNLQSIDMTTREASYLAAESKMTLTGKVKVVSSDKKANRFSEMTGSSGVILFFPRDRKLEKGQSGIKKATIEGPVTFSMKFVRDDKSKTTPEWSTISGWADQLVFDDDGEPMITLTGNVKLTGDDPSIIGDMSGSKAVIYLDKANRQPVRIKLSGPGESNVKDTGQKSGSGGGG